MLNLDQQFDIQSVRSPTFQDGDGLIFGSEGHGVPDWLHSQLEGQRLTIPHKNTAMRSLNLATSAGIATYEAIRQLELKS
ncbi:MAG: TrmH family RNA methyltransferase [Opitutaceae bacterium]